MDSLSIMQRNLHHEYNDGQKTIINVVSNPHYSICYRQEDMTSNQDLNLIYDDLRSLYLKVGIDLHKHCSEKLKLNHLVLGH